MLLDEANLWWLTSYAEIYYIQLFKTLVRKEQYQTPQTGKGWKLAPT